jgi:RNA polymerase sigma factor (sigma-70 family)
MALTIVAMSDLAGPSRRPSEAGFEVLVQAEAQRLYRLALAIVDEPHEAEDAVQDTMVIAWRRWSSLEGFSNQSAWLTRVCVRECLRRRRSFRRRHPWIWDRERPEDETFVADLGVRLMDVHRAYQHLSPRQRAMVTLHHHDGYTVEQCAVILECSPGTARSHLGRAMAKLRKELADD